MRVAITGSSGLIGTALRRRLESRGHDVLPVLRGDPAQEGALWDPVAGRVREGALEAVDAVVHLAGADIAGKRWTERRRRVLWDSRVESARLLVDHIGTLSQRPKVLVSASAVGVYGDRGDEVLTEQSTPGGGFLAELCQAWEREARRAEDFAVRAVQIRTAGTVLALDGGALLRLLPLFRLGVGGRLGSGRQWFTWIALDDEVGAIEHLIGADDVSGPVNLTSPQPVTNAEFTRALGRVLHRPALLPAPAFALRLLLGGVADGALLASQRALPSRLEQSGYRFVAPELEQALALALQGAQADRTLEQ